MYYINQTADTSGNHGNPVSHQTEGMVLLPESLLTEYIHTMGFAYLTVDDGTVTAIAINQEAYDAYQADHKETPPDPEHTAEEDLMSMTVDHEYRITMLELGITE